MSTPATAPHEAILRAIGNPLMVVGADDVVEYGNDAAEVFFDLSRAGLARRKITELVPFGCPLLALIAQVRQRGAPANEYGVSLKTPNSEDAGPVDVQVAPMADAPGAVLVFLTARAMAIKIDRQLSHRDATRSVVGLASILGHEIKNPLSGIRGAAQLLQASTSEADRDLPRLIVDEVDRICRLIDRLEVFTDDRPLARRPVNIHQVLDRVHNLARNGFARHIRIVKEYDPSLPSVLGVSDQLIQVFLNLVKNAAEAVGPAGADLGGDALITLRTGFRPGFKLSVPGTPDRVNLPLEFIVADNGPGMPDDILATLFDPFVTTKATGSGLGLSLVAKIVGDHGGVIECSSGNHGTRFRVLMPMHERDTGHKSGANGQIGSKEQ